MLVTEGVGAAEIVREVDGGLVVAGKPENLARTIIKQIVLTDNMRDMGRRAQNLVMKRYGWPTIARQMEIEYQHVLSSIHLE